MCGGDRSFVCVEKHCNTEYHMKLMDFNGFFKKMHLLEKLSTYNREFGEFYACLDLPVVFCCF